MTPNDATPWGTGDLISIAIGIIVLLTGLLVAKKNRNVQAATVLLATGISLGPLLLIIADPLGQELGYNTRLLSIVLTEGRATLWWAAAVATLYLLRDIV
jgi:hypothetical protein